MKTRYEGILNYLRIPAALFLLRFLRWVWLLLNAIPQYGRRGILVCALPKSGSSFFEEFIAAKLQLKPLVAVTTIWRESFYGDTHNSEIGLLDIWIINNFGVIIKTHSLPHAKILHMLSDEQLLLLSNDPKIAAYSDKRHRQRHQWHARNRQKGVIIDTVYKEFVIWIDRADALDARFPRFNTQSLEKDLFNYFDLPAKDMLYEQVQKKSVNRNPNHYKSLK